MSFRVRRGAARVTEAHSQIGQTPQLTLAWWAGAPADYSLNLFQDNFGSDATLDQDWLALPTQGPAPLVQGKSSIAMLGQQTSEQQSPSVAVVDKAFSRLATAMEDFEEFGDF